MHSPRRTPARERAIIPRWMRALVVLAAATISGAISAASLAPASSAAPVENVQLPTLAESGPDLGVLLTAPMVAVFVILMAGAALVIAAVRRRSTD